MGWSGGCREGERPVGNRRSGAILVGGYRLLNLKATPAPSTMGGTPSDKRVSHRGSVEQIPSASLRTSRSSKCVTQRPSTVSPTPDNSVWCPGNLRAGSCCTTALLRTVTYGKEVEDVGGPALRCLDRGGLMSYVGGP